MVKSLSWGGAYFHEAVNPKRSPRQDLLQSALDVSSKRCQAIGIASDTFLIELLLSNILFKNFPLEAFLAQIQDPVADGCG